MTDIDIEAPSDEVGEVTPGVGGMPSGWAPDEPEISERTGKPKRRYNMMGKRAHQAKSVTDSVMPPLPVTGEKRPSVGRPRKTGRKDTGGFFGGIWNGVGLILTNTGIDAPVGRVLQFESGMAGVALDKMIDGTMLDRLIQPMLGKKSDGQLLLALVGLPLIVGAMERNQETADQLAPLARMAMIAMLPNMVTAMKDAKKAEDKLAADLALLAPTLGIPEGTPITVDDILAYLFQPAPTDA